MTSHDSILKKALYDLYNIEFFIGAKKEMATNRIDSSQ